MFIYTISTAGWWIGKNVEENTSKIL